MKSITLIQRTPPCILMASRGSGESLSDGCRREGGIIKYRSIFVRINNFVTYPLSLLRYNLDEYMQLFMWIENKKKSGEDPFWALAELVRQDNSATTLRNVMEREGQNADTEGVVFDEVEDAAAQREAEEEEEREADAEESNPELFYFFDCVFCKSIFREKDALVNHVGICTKK